MQQAHKIVASFFLQFLYMYSLQKCRSLMFNRYSGFRLIWHSLWSRKWEMSKMKKCQVNYLKLFQKKVSQNLASDCFWLIFSYVILFLQVQIRITSHSDTVELITLLCCLTCLQLSKHIKRLIGKSFWNVAKLDRFCKCFNQIPKENQCGEIPGISRLTMAIVVSPMDSHLPQSIL